MFKILQDKKGFTLIELIVVIAILGVLAAIALPNVVGFVGRAGETADKVTAESITKAISILVADGIIEDSVEIVYEKGDDEYSFDKHNDAIQNLVGPIVLKSCEKLEFTISDGQVVCITFAEDDS